MEVGIKSKLFFHFILFLFVVSCSFNKTVNDIQGNFGDSKLVIIRNKLYIFVNLNGFLFIKSIRGKKFTHTNPLISTDWFYVLSDELSNKSCVYMCCSSFKENSVRVYKIDLASLSASKVAELPKIKENSLNIDPTMTKIGTKYFIAYTAIEGNVNNREESKENGLYTVSLFGSKDLNHWEKISEIVSKKKNIEDGDLIFDKENNILFFVYKEKILDRKESYIKIAFSEDFGKSWNFSQVLLPARADQEPAGFLRLSNNYLLFFSSDIKNPRTSYSGSEIYCASFEFNRKKKNFRLLKEVSFSFGKGILLLDVAFYKNSAYFLGSKII